MRRDLLERPIGETYRRDLNEKKKNYIYIYERPTGGTYKRDLYGRMVRETNAKDLLKRPTEETNKREHKRVYK